MKIKCQCGYECPVEVSEGSYNVGERMKQTGMKPIFLSDGESAWLCAPCYEEVVQLVHRANQIIRSDGWSPCSVSRA